MGRTFIRQDAQIGSTGDSIAGFSDSASPGSTLESGASNLADDLNNIRSVLHLHKNNQNGNWYDDLITPSALDPGSKRGINDLNSDLHGLERKRILRPVASLVDVSVPGGQNYVVLGTGELPSQTTAAVGAVTTQGTVVAEYTGTFGGAHSLDEVGGSSAINPKNLGQVVDASTRDPILSGDREVFALWQSENGTDGHTIDDSSNQVQLSFVRVDSSGDDLEAVPVADIENQSINYISIERVGLDDLNEQDFLRPAVVDILASATVTRQVAYDNQGTTPVDITTDATLDLEGSGLIWSVRDDLEQNLLRIIEGSSGDTSEIELGSEVDIFDVDAQDVDFAQGVSVASSKSRPIDIGENDGVMESTAGELEIRASDELFLDDGNQSGSTWSQTQGIKLSETTAEWDSFETNFGEVSLLNAINQAVSADIRTKVQAVLTSDVAAEEDVNGPGTSHANTDVDLAPYDQVTFADDVEVFLNGELLRNAPDQAGGEDVYPGGDPSAGDLAFQFQLKGTGAKPDQLTVVVHGQ